MEFSEHTKNMYNPMYELGFEQGVSMGKYRAKQQILRLLHDDETMHNIWWCIKREDNFPGQEFIADVIREFLIIQGDKNA